MEAGRIEREAKGTSVGGELQPLTIALADLAIRASMSDALDPIRALAAHNLAVAMSDARMTNLPTAHLGNDSSPGAQACRIAARIYCRIQDDWYRGCHVGAVVLPAVLATRSRDIIPALAAGYAVNMALAQPFGLEALGKGLRPTSLFGPASAAAAAAVALGCDRDVVATAIAIALSTSGGNNQSIVEGGFEWQVQVLQAARMGLESALIAQAGFAASQYAIEGPAGFLAVALNRADGAALLRNVLAEPSMLNPNEVDIKPFPGSSFAAPAIGAALRASRLLGSEPVKQVTVTMTPAALTSPGAASPGPFPTDASAVLSIPLCVAQAYTTGRVGFGQPIDENTWTLLAKIVLEPSSELLANRAIFEVETASRTVLVQHDSLISQRPNWLNTGADPHALADRCEAPRAAIRMICDALLAPKVAATDILVLTGTDKKTAREVN